MILKKITAGFTGSKTVCSILLLLVVLVLIISQTIFATGATDDSYSDIFVKNSNSQDGLVSHYGADDKVRIIIVLDDKPLMDRSEFQKSTSAKKYLSTKSAKNLQRSLLNEQKQVQSEISSNGIHIKSNYHYTTIINGISAEARYGEIEKISRLDGVKNVYISQKYNSIDPKLTDSTETIGASQVQNTGYTGKHTVTAILDTGLDLSHEAFQGSVNNPKYSKNDIENSIRNNHLTMGTLSADVLYHSSKIPFAFDYADNDTNVSGGENHGTHVSGIVGANSGGTVKGVAPDTQFFIMKVFGDKTGGAYDEHILAALEDSIKLGCDNINMSLGTSCGFSQDSSNVMRSVYSRIEDAGINLMCAAGNDYSSSYHGNSNDDLPLASNPDNSTLSSPSSYSAATSVASINNSESRDPYFIVNDEKIRYLDSGEKEDKMFSTLSGTFEYIDCGNGGAAAFSGLDITGKIALVQRGGEENGEILTFKQKENNAEAAGAIAVIIYDNVEGDLVSMETDHNIPAIFINMKSGEKMLGLSEKTLHADPDYIDKFKDTYSGKMSDFSSWGVTPDLKLKPEITAPGGSIYSTLPDNKYGNMSGTSMASPHMAGAAAVMEQYVNEELGGSDMTLYERTNIVNSLIMSTASQVKDEDGNTVSPRKQGAGLVQLQNAVNAGAYLTSSSGGKPVISMGDSSSGDFSFDFLLNRIKSDNNSNYQVSVNVQSEDTVRKNGKTYIAQKCRMLNDSEIIIDAPDSVKIASQAQRIKVSLSLTDEGKKFLDSSFPNGIFIEGYVTLTPSNGSEKVALSIPFMGFYGEWSDTPLFDKTIYDKDDSVAITPMYLGQFDNRTGGGYILGHNNYGDAEIYDADKIAIKGGDSGSNVTAVSTLLRNASRLEYSVSDSEGTVYSETQLNVNKTYYSSSEGFYQPFATNGWRQKDEWNDPLPDGKYTYTVKGYLTSSSGKSAKTADEVNFPVTIDSEDPVIVKSEIKGNKWTVTVKDNHYVQAVGVTTGGIPLTGWVNPDEDTTGAETEVTFDLSDPEFKGVEQAKIALVDYADNQVVSGYYNISDHTAQDDLDSAVKYYRTDSNDSEWAKASSFDANSDGIIDIEDFVILMQH